jgi:hypothetical protein
VPDPQRLTKGAARPLGPVARQDEARKSLLALFWGKPEGLPSFWFTTNFRWSKPIHHWPGYGLTQTPPVQAEALREPWRV